MTWNDDGGRRIHATVASNLVAMDNIVYQQIVVVTNHGVINDEIFESDLEPLVRAQTGDLPLTNLKLFIRYENQMIL